MLTKQGKVVALMSTAWGATVGCLILSTLLQNYSTIGFVSKILIMLLSFVQAASSIVWYMLSEKKQEFWAVAWLHMHVLVMLGLVSSYFMQIFCIGTFISYYDPRFTIFDGIVVADFLFLLIFILSLITLSPVLIEMMADDTSENDQTQNLDASTENHSNNNNYNYDTNMNYHNSSSTTNLLINS